MKKLCYLIIALCFAVGCQEHKKESVEEGEKIPLTNSIYHWKTTFELSAYEEEFIRKHNIKRMYIHMFDVAIEHNFLMNKTDIIPIATTKFISDIPNGVEVIPTVYITIEALRGMGEKSEDYADLIVERLLAMSSYNECRNIREIQFDCDWTSSTKVNYVNLCKRAQSLLKERNIILSTTIRLHQLSEEAPPVDRGVLMLYNTGAIKNPSTENSILDIKDVKPYLKTSKYSIPLDYAYPAFGWGVKFNNGEFARIVTYPDEIELSEGETIRKERVTNAEILEVKKLIEAQLGRPSVSNIIYHLDEEQLKNYSDEEFYQIFGN